MNINNKPGPDGIHPLFLVKCKDILIEPLSKIFNISLKSGIFPDCWKSSYIIPIYKNGNATDVNNYRPICKMSTFPKIFDSIICDKMSGYIYKFIIPQQHGFFPDRSVNSICVFIRKIFLKLLIKNLLLIVSILIFLELSIKLISIYLFGN